MVSSMAAANAFKKEELHHSPTKLHHFSFSDLHPSKLRASMAEASSILHPSKLPTPKCKIPSPEAQKATSRVFPSILYKLILFVIVIALLPMFPSQAPEFIGESISTRLWELLHLVFIGIAVSYGIFSQRHAEPDTDKVFLQEGSHHSFVSQMIHVSPVFDEEDDEIDRMNESRIQSWSFQCYRNEPPNLVASKHRPLPVRSIKQQNQEIDEQSTSANGRIEDRLFDSKNESAVLPSPIPWISRSGSKGNKVELQVAGMKGSSTVPSTPASPTLPSPRRLSPSPSFSSDTSKPKSIYKNKANPPPPPPPPPPPEYLKHEHGYHANLSMRECRNASDDDTTRPINEQAKNRGEDVAEASGGAPEETSNSNREAGGGEENEVDKKADEFIARFREQIRLQRIESIKRSTKQRSNRKQQIV